VHAESHSYHEGTAAQGRPHHQQRLDLGARAAALLGAYTATKHAVTGLTKCISLDGRKDDIAAGQIDIGNAATEMTERMTKGVPQANGTTMVEPRMDVAHVDSAVLYMANLPLDANVQFMTIMATKMPFIGRG
jgi:NADP-dependent 3-hydroxy acid dehydrogenase YdfG